MACGGCSWLKQLSQFRHILARFVSDQLRGFLRAFCGEVSFVGLRWVFSLCVESRGSLWPELVHLLDAACVEINQWHLLFCGHSARRFHVIVEVIRALRSLAVSGRFEMLRLNPPLRVEIPARERRDEHRLRSNRPRLADIAREVFTEGRLRVGFAFRPFAGLVVVAELD